MTTTSLRLSKQLLVGEVLRRAAYGVPDEIAFADENVSRTYQDIETRALQFANWLITQGLEKEDKVAFLLKNGVPFVETFYGIALSGTVGVPLNFRLSGPEIEYILGNSDSRLLVLDAEFLPTVIPVLQNVPNLERIIVVGDTLIEDVPPNTLLYEELFVDLPLYQADAGLSVDSRQYQADGDLSDDDPFMIVYTSGTTGRPKGAVLSHKNLMQNCFNTMFEMRLRRGMSQLVVPPLFHIAAMSTIVTSAILQGTSVIHREFSPQRILETIQRQHIDMMFLVPAMWNFLLQEPGLSEYDTKSLRFLLTGGAVCPLELKRRLLTVFPNGGLYDAFGQTEMSPVVTCLLAEDTMRKTMSVGKPVINVELRVVDDNMNDVPVGEIGEAVYRGPTVMKGYYKNPAATEQAFSGGWFHSGDLVRMDEEGFVYIVDRKKDMLISGGENIYPTEVEEALYAHPGVLEAAVIGVPDEVWGESVKAFVACKPGTHLTAEEVIAHCATQLASYKKPRYVEFVETLPRNAAGKVLKRVLRERSASGAEGAV